MNFSTVATSARRPASRDRRSSSGPVTPWASRAALASSVARPYAELILWRPLPSARATKESRGIEIATARAFGPAGTCSRMIVSVCSWPSSSPARSSASSPGGRGLPDASVRLSSPTRSAVNGCSGSGATVRLLMTSLVTTRSVSVRWTIQPYPVPTSNASDSIAATARPIAPATRRSRRATPLIARIVARRRGWAPHERRRRRRREVPRRHRTRHGRARRRGDAGHPIMIGRHERRCRSRLGDRYLTAVTPRVRARSSTSPNGASTGTIGGSAAPGAPIR